VACTSIASPETVVGAPSPEEFSEFQISLLLIHGEEDTNDLHIVALDIETPIDETKGYQERIDDINAQGGIAIIAHPGYPGFPAFEHVELLKELDGYTGFELKLVIASVLWDIVLTHRVREGKPLVWGFTSDDSHAPPYPPSAAFIMVRASDLTEEEITESIREGSFYSTLGGAVIEDISLSEGIISVNLSSKMEIAFIKEMGEVIETVEGVSAEYEVSGDEGYVRIEVRDRNSVGTLRRIAWTQPFRVISAENIENPYDAKGNWYKGNTHCHTTESDGELPPRAVVWCYQTLGYDFLAITDHNKITIVD